jgi:AcrR family transcriptional regulator
MNEPTFRTKKSLRTFETVLKAATDLFGRQGYHGTTMRDIARESGLGLGALYYYFESKEELVLLFYERVNGQVLEAFRSRQEVPTTLPEALANFLRLKLEHLRPYRDLLRVVMKEAIDPGSPLCPLNAASARSLASSLALFREMIARAEAARGAEIEEMARGLWMAHMGILAYWLHDKSADFQATDRAIDTLAGLVRLSNTIARVPGMNAMRRQVYTLIAGLFPEESHADPIAR